jgi:hypothetical protein
MAKVSKDLAVQAWCILEDFLADLITGVRAFEYFATDKFTAGATPRVQQNYRKMTATFLYLTLAKWIEFYGHYRAVIPPAHRKTCKDLRNELERRGVRIFRNTVVGHIWSKDEKRPLLNSEIEKLDQRVTGGDGDTFLRWINDPANNHVGTTIVGTTEAVRDAITACWDITDEDRRTYLER